MATTTIKAGLRWRRYRPKRRVFAGPISFIPLVNIALLLVIFMLLNSGFVLRPGFVIQLPTAEFVAGGRYDAKVVTLTQEGLVFFDDERWPLEDLAQAFMQAASKNRDLSLTVEADSRVPYGTVVRVMNMATAAGIRQVNLATRPALGEEILP